MTASHATLPDPIAETLIQIKSSTVTAENDVTGSSGGGGVELVYVVQIHNTLNSATSYTKVYNAADATAGERDPDVILPCPGGTTIEYVMLDGIPMREGGGGSPNLGISLLTVVEPGTSGNTSPTGQVEVRMLIDT